VDFAPGDRVDRYVLVQELGEGGQGSVWRAEDPLSPEKPRAIKLVPLVLARPNDVERVRREARALARLEHPSLVRCHALFEDLKHSALGVVMDFVDGMSLRAAADEPWITDHHRTMALKHIARALAYVHQNGVVHRDLKLDNVLVTRAFWDAPDDPGNVKVVDFGIAKVADGSHALTALDAIVGTLAYLSPELLDPAFFKSTGITAASDVFAFGVVGYKLLVGGHPTGLGGKAGIVDYGAAYRAVADREPPWPTDLPADSWGHLLADCLRVQPSQRIADGTTLVHRCEDSGEVTSRLRSTPQADPLAPTAQVVPPDPERAARALAATQRDVAVPARPEVGANTLTSGNGASRTSEPRSKVTPIVVALLLAGGVGAGALLLRPSGPPSPPIEATSVPSATPSQAPPRPGPLVVPTPDDAPTEADVIESPTRPHGCSADRPICECCPSGRDCGPGACDDGLNPDESWHLKLAGGTAFGREIGVNGLDQQLCLRIKRAGERPSCTRLAAPDAGSTPLMYVSGGELTGFGLELELRDPSDAGVPLRAVVKRKMTRLVLCQGIDVDLLGDGGAAAKLRFFLDDPSAPAQACRPPR